MNRIPTEGLKRAYVVVPTIVYQSLNEQNPDRGIETRSADDNRNAGAGLNEQNPDRGIETDFARQALNRSVALE